jgi:hypothetical protein
MRNFFNSLFILILCSLIYGCAFGQRIEYRGYSDFSLQKDIGSVSLGVQDKRLYILNNNKKPNFVGLSKSIYGIPYDVTTQSGNPLADDFASLIAESLIRSNINVKVVQLHHNIKKNDAISKILNTESDNYILITLNEWKTEVHFRAGLFFDVTIDIIGVNGDVISTANQSGFDFFAKDSPGRENLSSAVVDIFDKLFNDEKIVDALSNE